MYISELIEKGGPAMYPLFGLSFLAWCIFVERMISLRLFEKRGKALNARIKELYKAGKTEECKELLSNSPALIASPFESVIENEDVEREIFEISAGRKIDKTILGLKKSMWVLATIATICPFIGLFGTVTGIMQSFDAIEKSGKSGFSIVAGGLAEALLTTAAGILIAVLAVCFFNYLQNKISILVQELKDNIEELIEIRLR